MHLANERAGATAIAPTLELSAALSAANPYHPLEKMMPSSITSGARSAIPSVPLGTRAADAENSTPATALANGPRPDDAASEVTATPTLGKRKCDPVRQRGRMTENGYQPENVDWVDDLTDPDPTRKGWRIGRDPMTIDPALLTMAGHPPRGTRARVSAKSAAMGDAEGWYFEVREYSHIPDGVCRPCAGSAHEVRQCSIINCPVWAYRLGRNPHSARRGKTPANYAALVKSRETRVATAAIDTLEAAGRLLDGMSAEERALLDGEAVNG